MDFEKDRYKVKANGKFFTTSKDSLGVVVEILDGPFEGKTATWFCKFAKEEQLRRGLGVLGCHLVEGDSGMQLNTDDGGIATAKIEERGEYLNAAFLEVAEKKTLRKLKGKKDDLPF